jgi:hypothetical protein
LPHLALERWNTNVMSKTDLILLGNIGTMSSWKHHFYL